MEALPKFGMSRSAVMKRVARFKDLKGSDGGLPDSKAPQCERTLYNVIGFQPPKTSAAPSPRRWATTLHGFQPFRSRKVLISAIAAPSPARAR